MKRKIEPVHFVYLLRHWNAYSPLARPFTSRIWWSPRVPRLVRKPPVPWLEIYVDAIWMDRINMQNNWLVIDPPESHILDCWIPLLIDLSIHLSIIHPSVYLFIGSLVYPPIHPSILPYITNRSFTINPSTYHHPSHLLIYSSVHWFTQLSTHPFIIPLPSIHYLSSAHLIPITSIHSFI